MIASLYADSPEHPDWLDAALFRTGEVALLFQVSRRSVSEWARTGKLPFVTTPGGHRRYRAGDVRALLDSASGRREDAPRAEVMRG